MDGVNGQFLMFKQLLNIHIIMDTKVCSSGLMSIIILMHHLFTQPHIVICSNLHLEILEQLHFALVLLVIEICEIYNIYIFLSLFNELVS